MELLEFNSSATERNLTLLNYERVKPLVEELLGQGYSPVRAAAIMFQYGYDFGRKLLKDSQKERRRQHWEEQNRPKDENESYSPTSGENEGSIING